MAVRKAFFGWFYYPARDMNALILLVILLCATSHLVQSIKARRALRRSRTRTCTGLTISRTDKHLYTSPDTHGNTDSRTTQHRPKRSAIYCCSVELGNWLYLAIFPKWMYAPESVNDALCTGLYCGVMGFYCYYRTPSIRTFS